MISQKLQTLFFLSILAFIAHGLEEYFTAFYDVDIFFKALYRFFDAMTVAQATFLLTQFFVWAILIIGFLFIRGGRWPLRLMMIPGFFLLFETHHIVKTFIAQAYYPGMITALILTVIGFFFWKELISHFQNT